MSISTDSLSHHVDLFADELLHWRRHLHRFPELSHQEKETAAFVESALRTLGIEQIQTGIGGYGLIADIEGTLPGKTIGIRADIDALPIVEKTNLEFASTRPGIMHSCGHDAHTAMLLGTARQFKRIADEGKLCGRVRLIFQPAEEAANAEGKSGGRLMVEAGILEGVDAVIAQHVSPGVPVGQYSFQPGSICASSDSFIITVKGTASHAANPNTGIDAILLASNLVQSIHHIVSRRVPPAETAVVSIGMIHGGTAHNIISDKVKIEGTFRAHTPKIRQLLIDELCQVCHLASALGGAAELEIIEGYPPLINDIPLTNLAEEAIRTELGDAAIHPPIGPTTGAEDFAFMTQVVPGICLRLGVKNSAWEAAKGAHTPDFVIDEGCLTIGTIGLVATATAWLHATAS